MSSNFNIELDLSFNTYELKLRIIEFVFIESAHALRPHLLLALSASLSGAVGQVLPEMPHLLRSGAQRGFEEVRLFSNTTLLIG